MGVLPRLADEMPSGSLISAAVKAFATAILDRGPDGRRMNFRSLEAYHSTLQRLRRDLVVSSMSFDVRTAASIACLAMVEVSHPGVSFSTSFAITIDYSQLIFPTSTKGFYTHFNGLGVLFQFYPPDLFSSDVYHTIFVGCRPILVSSVVYESFIAHCSHPRQLFHALDRRKPTFLAQVQWKTKPFCFYPPSDLQLLIGDAATIPSLLEAIDGLSSLPSDLAISEAQRIRQGLLEVQNCLHKWESLHQMDSTYPLFSSLMTANVHTHALSFEIICLKEIEKVEMLLTDYGITARLAADETVEIDYSDRKVSELARQVLSAVDHFLQDEMRLFGPASAVFPLRVAYKVLSKDYEGNQCNIRRCRKLIARIRERGISAVPHFPARVVDFDFP